jgi:hypothetical protein
MSKVVGNVKNQSSELVEEGKMNYLINCTFSANGDSLELSYTKGSVWVEIGSNTFISIAAIDGDFSRIESNFAFVEQCHN